MRIKSPGFSWFKSHYSSRYLCNLYITWFL